MANSYTDGWVRYYERMSADERKHSPGWFDAGTGRHHRDLELNDARVKALIAEAERDAKEGREQAKAKKR